VDVVRSESPEESERHVRGVTDREVLAAARQLRHTQTRPEALLWERLRARRLGPKFRRQHPVGALVLDFYCAAAKLAVEIDGATNGDEAEGAPARDRWLAGQGIRVLHLPAVEVLSDTDAAVRKIRDALLL
jgi:very-short-patch-repair endonuclease